MQFELFEKFGFDAGFYYFYNIDEWGWSIFYVGKDLKFYILYC